MTTHNIVAVDIFGKSIEPSSDLDAEAILGAAQVKDGGALVDALLPLTEESCLYRLEIDGTIIVEEDDRFIHEHMEECFDLGPGECSPMLTNCSHTVACENCDWQVFGDEPALGVVPWGHYIDHIAHTAQGDAS